MNKLSLKNAPVYQVSSRGIVPYLKGLPEFKPLFVYFSTIIPPSLLIKDVQVHNNFMILDIDYISESESSEKSISIPKDFPQKIEAFLIEKGIHTIYFNTSDGELNDYRETIKVLFIHKQRTSLYNITEPIIDYENRDIVCNSFYVYINNQEGIELRNFKDIHSIEIATAFDSISQVKLKDCININKIYLFARNIKRIEIDHSEIETVDGIFKNRNTKLICLKNMKTNTTLNFQVAPNYLELDTNTVVYTTFEESYIKTIDCMHSSAKVVAPFKFSKTKLLNTENAFLVLANSHIQEMSKRLAQKVHFICLHLNSYDTFLTILQECTEPIQVDILKIQTYSQSFDTDKDYTIHPDVIPNNIQFIFEGPGFKKNETTLIEDFTKRIGKSVQIRVMNLSQNTHWYEIEE
jgi:hypothetical protein